MLIGEKGLEIHAKEIGSAQPAWMKVEGWEKVIPAALQNLPLIGGEQASEEWKEWFFAKYPLRFRWWIAVPAFALLLALVLAFFWYRAPARLEAQMIRVENQHWWNRYLPGERLGGDTTVQEEEKVRFAFTSPSDGYLYVVDREIASDDRPHPAYLVFPTKRTGTDAGTAVKAGQRIFYPNLSADPPYVYAKRQDPSDTGYLGELFTVYIREGKLDYDLTDDILPLPPGDPLLRAGAAPESNSDIPSGTRGLQTRLLTQPRFRLMQQPSGKPLYSLAIFLSVRAH
jgi:hypothetical protein